MSRALVCLMCAGVALYAQDWLTWGGSPDRVGWANSESIFNRENVGKTALKWRAQLDLSPKFEVLSSATAPLVAEGVRTSQGVKDLVYVVGNDDLVYALDADNGRVIWKKKFTNSSQAPTDPTYLCPNTQNATPVIDKPKGRLYVVTSDGKLRALSLGSGDEAMTAVDFVPPFSRTWSLNLLNDVIYTPVGRGCGNAISHFAAIDLGNSARPVSRFYTSAGRPAGAWGRGGLVLGPKWIYGQTAEGAYDPASGKFGNSVMAMSLGDLRLVDSFTPSNTQFLTSTDLDLGSASPVFFPFEKWQLLAAAGKESAIYLLDANHPGGKDHHTPLYQFRWGNDESRLWGRGVWGAMATWLDPQGQRWLLVPMWGPLAKGAAPFPNSYGSVEEGALMAFRVLAPNDEPVLDPVWISRDMHVPDPPVIANGVVFSVATGENTRQGGTFRADVRAKPFGHAVLYAFDALTGKELYSSGDTIPSWVHFGGLAVSKGRVYFCTWDGSVYAFGVR